MISNMFTKFIHDFDVDFKRLVDKYGTPLYFLDAERVRENYLNLHSNITNLWKNSLICYAYKANSTLALLKVLRDMGAGAEVVSGGELYAAKLVNMPPERIVFDGVSKSPLELAEAIRENILLINVESMEELSLIDKFASKFNVKVSLGIRINFDVKVDTHHYITTGRRFNKFGMDPDSAYTAYKKAQKMKNVNVKGIHIHIGSQILDIFPYVEVKEKLVNFCRKLKSTLKLALKYVDLGGGFGISYREYEKSFPISDYCETVVKPLTSYAGSIFDDDFKIILEPGRFIVGDAGILITRVNYVKESGGYKWVLVDAGMNDLIRPALYGAFHPIIPLSKVKDEYEIYNIAGPICESSDIFYIGFKAPLIRPGDLLAILNVGAYGISMSSQYNCRPRAAVVMRDNGEIKLVRRRENYNDIFGCDILEKS